MKTKKPNLKKQLADSLADRQSLKNMHATATEQLALSRQSVAVFTTQLADLRQSIKSADETIMRFRMDAAQAREGFARAEAAAFAWERAFEMTVGKVPAK